METAFPLIFLIPISFVCEFIDSSLGMGYGTTLTPLLLLCGFEPLTIVPAVLFSEFVSGFTAACFHHSIENVQFNAKSQDTKVATVLTVFSVIGTILAVYVAVSIPKKLLTLWIGVIVVAMGIIIIATYRRTPRFRWRKIVALGTIASFNKGLSGGGYGPLVMGGQMLSGINVKNAVGITSLTESFTCLTGVIVYYIMKPDINWSLAPWLMSGAVISVPFAAHLLKRLSPDLAKRITAALILILGISLLYKALVH